MCQELLHALFGLAEINQLRRGNKLIDYPSYLQSNPLLLVTLLSFDTGPKIELESPFLVHNIQVPECVIQVSV